MLKNIEISGYKKIGPGTLILDNLGPVTYLVGKNNSGKTSILEALSLATIGVINNQDTSLSSRIRDIFTDYQDVFNKDLTINQFDVTFTDFEDIQSSFKTTYSPDGAPHTNQFSKKFPKAFYIKCSDSSRRKHGTDGQSILNEINSIGTINPDNIPDWVFYKEAEITDSECGSKKVGSSKKFKLLQTLLSDVLDIRLTDIDKSARNNEIFFRYSEPGSKTKKKIYLAGSGTRSFINICAAVIYADDAELILIDEPEIHLHASLEEKLVDVFETLSKQTGKQFIIATQSPFLISANQKNDIFLCQNGKTTKVVSTGVGGKNLALAMELGSTNLKAVGAPDNYVLLEEDSLKIILDTAKKFYKNNKDIIFISCGGNQNVPNIEVALKNIDEHNLLIKCNPLYSKSYFIVVDKLSKEERAFSKIVAIEKSLGSRFIELTKESIEDMYLKTFIQSFKEDNSISGTISEWVKQNDYQTNGCRKKMLATYVANKMKKSDFEKMFPELIKIFN